MSRSGGIAYPRGVLGQTRVAVSVPNTVIGAGGAADMAGFSVAFVYGGRPIRVQLRAPWSKFSVANDALQLRVIDVATGKIVWQEGYLAPPIANAFFTAGIDSDPLTAYVDGTGLVVDTAYNWKAQVISTAGGTYAAVYAANSAFQGALAVVES